MNPQYTETATEPAKTHGRPQEHGSHPGGSPRGGSRVMLYTVPAIVLAAFAGLIFWRVQSRQRVQAELVPAAQEATVFPVAVAHPRHTDTHQEISLPGNVQAYVETPIYARTNGYLKRWYVDIGGRVQTGQLLATIDTPEVDQQLRQAEAAQLQAQANLDLAKTTADRWQNLLKSDGVSQQEVDQNVAAYKARQADFAAAVANVERLKYLQSFQQVTAPFAGVVTQRNVDIGALIESGNSKQLFQLAQINILRVYVSVPEGYSNDVKIGMTTQVHIAEFPNRVFAGKVAHTAGAIDPTSRTLLTEVQIENSKGDLLPGSYAQVGFHFQEGATPLVVPATAMVFRSAGPQVAVVEGKNTARLRSVRIGRDFGSSLEIISGLDPSDTVILNPPDSLTDGTRVDVQASAAQAAPAASERSSESSDR